MRSPILPSLLILLVSPASWATGSVELLVLGQRPGVERAQAAINSPTLLLDRYAGTGVQVSVDRSGPGVFCHRRRCLFAPGQILGTGRFQEVLESLRPRLAARAPLALLSTRYNWIFQGAEAGSRDLVTEMWAQNQVSKSVPELARHTGWYTPVDSSAGELGLVEWGSEPSGESLPLDALAWERRNLLISKVADDQGEDRLYLLERPRGDAGRMVRVAAGAGPSLLLDPGLAWPGNLSAEEEEAVDKRRAALGFAAVLPTTTDLAQGARGLVRRRDGLGIPFVAANLELEGGERLVQPSRYVDVGAHRIAIVGLVSEHVVRSLPWKVAGAIRVGDPLRAAQRSITDLYALERPPDLVVLLVDLDPEALARLKDGVRQADVIVGSFSRPGLVAPEQLLLFPHETPSDERPFYRQPQLVTHAAAAETTRITATFEDGRGLRSLRASYGLVDDAWEPDPVLARVVARQRLAGATSEAEKVLPDLDGFAAEPSMKAYLRALPDLYPTLPEAQRRHYPLRFTDRLFSVLTANVIRRVTGAEVVAIRPVVRSGDGAGVISAGEVRRWLEREPDRLAVVALPGALLVRLVTSTPTLVLSGMVKADGGWFIQGRSVEDAEHYHVALGDSLLLHPVLSSFVDRSPPILRFARVRSGRWRPEAAGEFLPLRQLTAAAIADLDLVNHPQRLAPLLREQGGNPERDVRIRLVGIDLRGGRINQGSPPLEGFPDGRLKAGEAASMGASGALDVEVSSPSYRWSTHGRFLYDAQFPAAAESMDYCEGALADDWVVGTEVSRPGWSVPMGFKASPFLGLGYDSQFFCPPRQALAFYGLGIGGIPGPRWQELKGTLSLRHDMTAGQSETDRFRPGARLGSRWSLPMGALRWSAEAGFDVFPGSGPQALELEGRITNQWDVPVGAGLAFRLRSDALVYMLGGDGGSGGRHSLTFGLAYERIFKPTRGIY